MRESIILGIDGGGTKTQMAVADSKGNILHEQRTGSTNHQSTSKVKDHFIELLTPHKEKEVLAAVLFLSGWDFSYDQKILRGHFQEACRDLGITPQKVIMENDIFAVLKAGLGKETCGACLIAGTGTLSAAMDGETFYRSYGMGYNSGEWGSGSDLGAHALYKVFAAHQGTKDPCPILQEKLLRYFNFNSVDEMAEFISHPDFEYGHVSRLAPSVFQSAQEGCQTSQAILERAGREHASSAAAMLNKLDSKTAPLVLGGGLIQHNGLLPSFQSTIKELVNRDNLEVRQLTSDPVWGSLLMAAETAGIEENSILEKISYQRRSI